MTKTETINLQRTLNNTGYGPITVDGVYGPVTASAYTRMLKNSAAGGVGNAVPAPAAAKPWWTSRAQVGWLLAIALSALSKWLGVELDADAWIPAILDTLSGISAIIGLYGSAKRDAPIDQALVLPGVRLPVGRVRESQRVPTGADEAARSPFLDP